MAVRGIRGATCAAENTPEAIQKATIELLRHIVDANQLLESDIAAAWFTMTPDLDAAFPARAARVMGWCDVPLMDAVEIPVAGALERCIRVLLFWNTDLPQDRIRHIYLGEARNLRPDLAEKDESQEALP